MGLQADGGLGPTPNADDPSRRVLGYLNFSSGQAEPRFLSALDALFRSSSASNTPHWMAVCDTLRLAMNEVSDDSAFSDVDQARDVLQHLEQLCPAYEQYHQSVLGHLSADEIFNSHFVGRCLEVLLHSLSESTQSEPIVDRSLRRLNDFIGYRPVATLETQKIEPYDHEWIRPIPLFIAGAGTAHGRYEAIVTGAIKLLEATPPPLLRDAYFDPTKLDELSIDPRVYDFDHPANKRPNHHFGMWDPHRIDGDGFYRRFVVQQVTMESLVRRVDECKGIDRDELRFEASAVLAGTILMASGISGFGPETHDSTVSLSELLARIAAYRDAFYEQLITSMDGSHGARLRVEAERLRQPFAGARQDLNRQLTKCRATQLQCVHLSRIYARMNFSAPAQAQADKILVASARFRTQIDCKLTRARTCVDTGELLQSLQEIESARREMLAGIQCGAIVDPWNILGFDCNFGLFGSIENSIRDYRIDDLVECIEEMLELYARIWGTAAASRNGDVAEQAQSCFESFANWWHQFAAHELDAVDSENPLIVYAAAKDVAKALKAWQSQGEASGDIGFWAPHVQNFDSCRAYWLVINTLLTRDDKVAALGLLMHWLSQSDHIPLEHGEASFYSLAWRWLSTALDETGTPVDDTARQGWLRIRRFFDYLEANAGDFWEVPDFASEAHTSSGEPVEPHPKSNDWDGEEEGEDELFGAAYEDVVYRDSTDDGVDGSIFDFESHDEDYLQQVSRPIVDRLTFLEQLAATWKLVTVAWSCAEELGQPDAVEAQVAESTQEMLCGALAHLHRTSRDLRRLTESVSNYRLSSPGADPESMEYYDRLRLLKDSLIDQIINTNVCVVEGIHFLTASVHPEHAETIELPADEVLGTKLLRAVLRGKPEVAKGLWQQFRETLESQAMLYVPLARGGHPHQIVRVKARQQLVQSLLHWLPRNGLLDETYQLIELVRQMERQVPVGSGAITEFDDLFEVCCRALVTALIDIKASLPDDQDPPKWLVSSLEEMMEPLLRSWLSHSRTLRLSVLEQVLEEDPWNELVEFIHRFGRDLFTQRFLNLGNIRGILHQGVESWLEHLVQYGGDPQYQPIIDALEHDLDPVDAGEKLTLILEAVVESYSEYRDYNSTTTQSDRGELLYTFLDFLRLRVSYDRVVWNLRPVVLAHKVLAEHGCDDEAEQWRHSLRTRIQGEAKRHMAKLHELQQQYAMNLPSISKRLSERFMRPLLIDYQCALIKPAMMDQDASVRQSAFDGICQQAESFMDEPSGAGIDVPAWLVAMEDTVHGLKSEQLTPIFQAVDSRMLPPVMLTTETIQTIIRSWHQE